MAEVHVVKPKVLRDERTLTVAGSGVLLGAVLDFKVDSRLACSCGISSQQENTAQGSLDRRKHVGNFCDFRQCCCRSEVPEEAREFATTYTSPCMACMDWLVVSPQGLTSPNFPAIFCRASY
jgi:hypothetical protein